MIKFEKLLVIAKAKFSDKSKLGDWYKTRLEICEKCPLSTLNTPPKTARDKAWVVANLGKPTCLGCGCDTASKASVRGEVCGAVKVGLPALWEALPELADTEIFTLKITNLNTDKATLTSVGKAIELDYGTVPNGFDSKVDIEMKDSVGDIEKVQVVPGCGCTAATARVDGGKAIFSISYDTIGRQGGVTKNFTVYYHVKGKKKVLMGKLLINVEAKK